MRKCKQKAINDVIITLVQYTSKPTTKNIGLLKLQSERYEVNIHRTVKD